MITHIVLFKPPAILDAGQRKTILAKLTERLAGIPTIRGCRIGRRVTHGLPGYEQSMREDFQYALLLEFDDLEGLRTYLAHPSHQDLGLIFSASSASLAYDYDMVQLEDAARLA